MSSPLTASSVRTAVGAGALTLALFGSALLWARFGEIVYFERLVAAIANCF